MGQWINIIIDIWPNVFKKDIFRFLMNSSQKISGSNGLICSVKLILWRQVPPKETEINWFALCDINGEFFGIITRFHSNIKNNEWQWYISWHCPFRNMLSGKEVFLSSSASSERFLSKLNPFSFLQLLSH